MSSYVSGGYKGSLRERVNVLSQWTCEAGDHINHHSLET